MSLQGRAVIVLLGLSVLGLIINLVRTKRLHVGYAVVWLPAIVAVITLVATPPLLEGVTRVMGAIFPASAMSLLGFVFIFLALIFISVQLSLLSNRVVEIAQHIALSNSSPRAEPPGPADGDAHDARAATRAQ